MMARSHRDQFLIVGAALALGLLLLTLRISRRPTHDGMAIFKGNPPPVPEYDAQRPKPKGLYDSGMSYPPALSSTSMGIPAATSPSTTSSPHWDPAWDDKKLWPNWSKPSSTPMLKKFGSPGKSHFTRGGP
ncbi:hypothetical protein N7462_010662 [Penicillium macrosclerotiorum]|uniref:uncharacterized protein n=1 Tax=Penicillium macrosclerotiorum TaxID=303699 RepID=UPI00254997C6|nr:uncharacterized protein N7462_010662 [Penicillium macrosclerotiorum]KAJ5669592.1 hypothetical protein N7462_010662 [Penicillium macrosclerotiorum]